MKVNSKRFENIECVTLDLDDTLWPVEPTLVKAEQAVYTWIGEHYPVISQRYTLDEISAKRITLSQQRKDIAYNVTELRRVALCELANEFNCAEDFVESALSLFRHHRNQVEPYKQSETVLKTLKQHFLLGAITNGNAQLDKISLGQYFDFVVTAEDVGVGKPHHQMFQQASIHAQTQLEKIVHVGDSPQTDVLGALKAGCKAIWLNYKRQAWPGGQTPDHVMHCISELPEILLGKH